jgi:Na+-transporting methylmalonyl-CoA/oxaloacetate decarboxylase gamma subunit
LTDADVDALEVFSKLESDYGEFGEFTGEYDIEELEDSVQVTLYADCADSDIVVKVTMEDNSSEYNYYIKSYMSYYSCTEDEAASTLKSSGCYPYKATEFEISADQTKAELMKSAGVNTLIGMGTVFIVLIFISFIISLLRFVPGLVGLFTKEGRASRKAAKETVTVSNDTKSDDIKEEAAPAQKIVSVTNAATGASAMDDGQLVAVIAAAVNAYAADGQQTYVNYPSNDKLIVRSFRRK